jgi:hypothetical protein
LDGRAEERADCNPLLIVHILKMPLIMENECKKNTFVAPALSYNIVYPRVHSCRLLPSSLLFFIVVYASSKKVVKKPLEKFIYDSPHTPFTPRSSPARDEGGK